MTSLLLESVLYFRANPLGLSDMVLVGVWLRHCISSFPDPLSRGQAFDGNSGQGFVGGESLQAYNRLYRK